MRALDDYDDKDSKRGDVAVMNTQDLWVFGRVAREEEEGETFLLRSFF